MNKTAILGSLTRAASAAGQAMAKHPKTTAAGITAAAAPFVYNDMKGIFSPLPPSNQPPPQPQRPMKTAAFRKYAMEKLSITEAKREYNKKVSRKISSTDRKHPDWEQDRVIAASIGGVKSDIKDKGGRVPEGVEKTSDTSFNKLDKMKFLKGFEKYRVSQGYSKTKDPELDELSRLEYMKRSGVFKDQDELVGSPKIKRKYFSDAATDKANKYYFGKQSSVHINPNVQYKAKLKSFVQKGRFSQGQTTSKLGRQSGV